MARRYALNLLLHALACVVVAQVGYARDAAAPVVASPAQIALHDAQQEAAIAALLQELGAQATHGQVLIKNVRIVDVVAGTVLPRQSVAVWNSTIYWVGNEGEEPKLERAVVVDGGGRFLSPGLVDMHVHSNSAADWLLDLANGVTAVREMDGFPWMLTLRDSVSRRRVLAPSLYVAGTIINAAPLEGYAVVPRNALDARRLVRQQSACGYDFIKVHNILPLPIFDAVADQASRLGMDLVGHVPHDISVRHAASRGMRTMEHLKGFLDDRTLKIGETDYAAVVDGGEVWNTPTLYASIGYARGANARELLARAESRYVPLRKRDEWRSVAAQADDESSRTGAAAEGFMREIVAKLAAGKAKFLAGTDADGYPFMIMGYALVDELQRLAAAGLPAVDVLRAATIEPARAMRVADEFGAIQVGKRADFVLLDDNPLTSPAAFKANRGVMAHGYWLDRKRLDAALDNLSAIYAVADDGTVVDRESIARVHADLKSQIDSGFAFDAMKLQHVADELRKAGFADDAVKFDVLANVPQQAPCAEALPN